MTDNDSKPSPTEALDAIHRTQTALADNFSRHTWSYDLTYAAGVGVMAGGMGLHTPLNIAIFVVALAGLLLLARNWKDKHGVWVSGTTPKNARWIAILLGLAIAALMAINLIAAYGGLPLPPALKLWFPLIIGVVAAALALRGSRSWRKVYRRESGLDQ